MVFLECLITRRNNAAGEEAAPGKGSRGKGGFGRGFQPRATGWAAQKGCALWALGLRREGSGARCPCSLWTQGMGCGRGAGAWAPPPAPAAASQGAAPEAWGTSLGKREDGKKWGCLVWERENSRRGGSFGGLGYREGADVFLGPGTRSCWGLGAGKLPSSSPWEVPKLQHFCPKTPQLWQPPQHCRFLRSFLGSFVTEGKTQAGFVPCPHCRSAFTPNEHS